MIQSRRNLKILGACALVLGLMTFVSAAAQAEVNSYWGYKSGMNLPKFGAALEPSLELALENKHGSLLTTILGIKVEILCTAITAVNMKLKAEGKVLGALRFNGCVIVIGGEKAPECEALSSGQPPGQIQTVTLEGLIRLHLLGDGTRDETVLFKPEAGVNLVTINVGEECPIGEAIPINGKFSVKDCENTFLTHKLLHLAEAFGPLTQLTVLGQPATLDGSVLVGLQAPHANLEWAGTPS